MSTGFSVEVLYVDGRSEWYDFHQQRTVVGSSPQADLSIRADGLSAQHLMVIPREGCCWVSVANDAITPVLWNGRLVDNQDIPWGTELDIGTITLRVGEPRRMVQERQKKQQVGLYVMAAAVACLALLWALQKKPNLHPTMPVSAPLLFSDHETSCPGDTETESPLQRGMRARGEASTYWQRYPFDAQEGIRAATLYELAQSCFAVSDEQQLVADMQKSKDAVRSTLERDYRTLRLQLSRALSNEEHGKARLCLARLMNLTAHIDDEYSDWLVRVEHYLSRAS